MVVNWCSVWRVRRWTHGPPVRSEDSAYLFAFLLSNLPPSQTWGIKLWTVKQASPDEHVDEHCLSWRSKNPAHNVPLCSVWLYSISSYVLTTTMIERYSLHTASKEEKRVVFVNHNENREVLRVRRRRRQKDPSTATRKNNFKRFSTMARKKSEDIASFWCLNFCNSGHSSLFPCPA